MTRTAPAPAVPLSEAETRALLDRLPPLEADAADVAPVALRPASLPRPRAGKTVEEPFPPAAGSADARPSTPKGPLTVVRRAPEGEVPLVPHVSVTFSQPMVDLTSHAELATRLVPVTLTPQPEGEWRWIGTQTVVFQPATRLPMATDYRVETRAGVTSVAGTTLDKPSAWAFSTPPPTLLSSYPKDTNATHRPVLFASFDQRIDPAAVLAKVVVKAGTSMAAVRLATREENESDKAVRDLAARAEAGRWLAFTTDEPLPADASVTVTVGTGTPSAEGPRQTKAPQSWTFRTYGPLKVLGLECGWGKQCPPGAPWSINFSNDLDEEASKPELIRVEPSLPDMEVDVQHARVTITGRAKAHTTYRVTLLGALRDVHGQVLGSDVTLSVTVGRAEPFLTAQAADFVVLDPTAPPSFTVISVGHPSLDVRMLAVTPADWDAYQAFLRDRWNDRSKTVPPGREVLRKTIPVAGPSDQLTATTIDLAPALNAGLGHAIVIVDTATGGSRRGRADVICWVQSTRIGLDAFAEEVGDQLLAWATNLEDGKPLAGVGIVVGEATATTDATGLARLPNSRQTASLVARLGADTAILPVSAPYTRGTSDESGKVRWFVADDRHLYRPGETVSIKGWIRTDGAGPSGDIQSAPARAASVDYGLMDSRQNEVVRGTAPVNKLGGFHLSLRLPPDMNLGSAGLHLAIPGASTDHAIQVEEFRRPEFEVKTEASEGPHFRGEDATVAVTASYFAGGALPGAPVTWQVRTSPGSFSPPNRDDFTFGKWVPWWHAAHDVDDEAEEANETFSGQTDERGRHLLHIEFGDRIGALPKNVHVEAAVQDVNRQSWTASSDLLVHPATVYVGLKTDRYFVQRGQPLHVDFIVTDLDGKAVSGRPVVIRAERLEWKRVRGEWKQVAAEPQDCTATSTADTGRCTFGTNTGGTYRILARVLDDKGRANETEIRRWVAGGTVRPQERVEQEQVMLIPDKRDYRPGDVAEVLIVPPFPNSEALITLRRSGLLRTERVHVGGASHVVRIPIEEHWTPNVHLHVDLVGTAQRRNDAGEVGSALPSRPAFAAGSLDLRIPPVHRGLQLKVNPSEKALEPGGRTSLHVELASAKGEPIAGGEVAIFVVDEAVLSLSGYQVPDPLSIFYASRTPDVEDHHSRSRVLLASAEAEPVKQKALARAAAGGMLAESMMSVMPSPPPSPVQAQAPDEAGKPDAPVRARTDFNPLAHFSASLVTDASGRGSVEVKLPDNLTRYRVMAVAVAPDPRLFGAGENTITARLPLMVRPSAPRFLNFGDHAELPVVIQNQTDQPLPADVAIRTTNLTLPAGAGRRVTVPANDRVEVRFPVATAQPGTARVQAAAASGRWSDAATLALPVWTPATTEAFATYGQVDAGAVEQRVTTPKDAIPQFGGLRVTTSSTALQALTDAVVYLVRYPYECSEQLASRVIAIAALKDVLSAFGAEGLPKETELQAAVTKDLARLAAMQNSDGGFALWRRGDESWPYVTVHVANALARAREKGFEVPNHTLDRARTYLREINRRFPKHYPDEARYVITAYALDVRRQLGERDAAAARQLLATATIPKLSFEALGWLLQVLSGDASSRAEVAAIRQHLNNRVTETANAAHFAVEYRDSAHLLFQSDRRADAILLDALIADQPASPLIPKIVEGLLGHRTAGRWSNTQENVFILLALDRYFRTFEKTTPDFVARVWLGEGFAGEHRFRGRTTERSQIAIPMPTLANAGPTSSLLIAKDGPGRLYYRVGLQYAPRDLDLQPMERGFTVERRYEAVDDKGDVRQDADGTWHIKAGARVRVRLTMVAPGRRMHVALVDPLPGGFEALNPALATTGTIPQGPPDTVTTIGAPGLGGPRRPGSWWIWMRPWFEHQNMRDERVEAFASLLWEGVWTYEYVARATTPGRFVVPPARAEEMYAPETFGRSGTARVEVQ